MTALHELTKLRERAECDAVAAVNRHYAQRFLKEMRRHLRRFNLSRHNVTISSGMGSACLCINGKVWPYDGSLDHRMDDVLCELRFISANLGYRWADYIHGESLTHYRS